MEDLWELRARKIEKVHLELQKVLTWYLSVMRKLMRDSTPKKE